jgi:hypothetical protein
LNRNAVAVVLLAVGPVLYPLATGASGAPHFPTRSECAHPARAVGSLDAVFGRFFLRSAADQKQRRVLELGFSGAEIERDGCGYFKVVVHGVPNLSVGRDLVAEARRVGLHVALEQAIGE